MSGSEESFKAADAQPGYAVGHKRPPLHTRFKPGQSGNPTGRAKGTKNLKTLSTRSLPRRSLFARARTFERYRRPKRSCEG
jgi:hypothetical protein